jgi:hypothetical protein
MRRANWISQPPQACRLLACASLAIGVISTSENRPEALSSCRNSRSARQSAESRSSDRLDCAGKKPGRILPSGELRRRCTSLHGEPLSFGTIADQGSTCLPLDALLLLKVSAPTRRCRIDESGLVTTQRVWRVMTDATLTKKLSGRARRGSCRRISAGNRTVGLNPGHGGSQPSTPSPRLLVGAGEVRTSHRKCC